MCIACINLQLDLGALNLGASRCTLHMGWTEVSVTTVVELFGVLRRRIPGRFLPTLFSMSANYGCESMQPSIICAGFDVSCYHLLCQIQEESQRTGGIC